MATNYATNATKRANQTIHQLAESGEENSPKLVKYDVFTLTADLSVADIIRYMIIPDGALIHTVVVKFDAMGGSGAVNVGWEASADAVESASATGFFSALSVASASTADMVDDAGTASGLFKRFSSACQLSLVVSTDTTATSGSIHVLLEYSIS